MIAQRQFHITRDGLAKLQAELEELRSVRRQEVASRILRAKEVGGTENNAEYDDAKDAQAFVEGRIMTLEAMLKNAVVIQDSKKRSLDKVVLGSRVTLYQDGKLAFYTIVGRAEANPTDGMISDESPVGHALLGKKKGSSVEVPVPAGKLKLVITDIA